MQFRTPLIRIVLLMLAFSLGACGGADARKAKYLDRGKAYLEQENYDKAAVELKNVLQIDPKHAEAYLLLAEVEERRNNHRQAFGAYAKAVELAPDNPHAQARLGRYYLASGDTTKAAELADAILSKHPTNAEARILKAAVRFRQGDESGALNAVKAVLVENPGDAEAAELASGIYQKQRNIEMAMSTLAASIEKNPTDVGMRLQLARLYSMQKQADRVEEILREVVKLEPQRLSHRATLAVFLAQTNQLDQAEQVLREAVKVDPNDAQRTLVLAEFLANRRSPEQAEVELTKAIKANPKAASLRFALGTLHEKRGTPDKAAEIYLALIADNGTKPDGLQARNMLGELRFRQAKLDEAGRLAAEVLKENPRDNKALLLRGRVALQKGDAVSAISSFRSVLKDQPESSEVLGLLGEAHAQNREPELAREHFHKAAEANPRDVAARVRFARFLAASGDSGAALKEIDRALTVDGNDVAALSTKAEIQANRRDFAGAESTLRKLKEAHPTNPMGHHLTGQLYAGQKKYDPAIREFEQALVLAPNMSDALAAIVTVHLNSGRPERAEERLEKAIRDKPDAALLHNFLGEVYLAQKKYDAAERSLARARELQPGWNAPHKGLATLYARQANHDAAIATLQAGLKQIPDDPMLLMTLAEVNERAGNFAASIDAYERVLARSPRNLVATNNLAALLADHRKDTDGLKRARELVAALEQSSEPALRDTAAWVYYRAGEPEKAISLLKPVVEKAPKVAVFQYHLGMAYHKQGDVQAAKLHLSKAVAANANFPGADEARATLSAIP